MTTFVDPTVNVIPLTLRRNQNLSEWEYFADDIKALCKTYDLLKLESNLSMREFTTRHSIPFATFQRYMTKYYIWKRTGVDTIRDGRAGRPKAVDDEGIIILRRFLRANVATQNCQLSMIAPFHAKVEEEACETRKRRGLAGLGCTVSKKTVKRIKEANKFVEVTCQFKTTARCIAEADPRNLYSFAVMNAAFVAPLIAAMVFNWDATQFCLSPDGYMKIIKCEGDTSKPPTSISAGGLGFAIKYYHFHNANGDIGPAVFIVADPSLGENEFHCFEMAGLSHTQVMTATGYVVFTRTRNCNAAFYRWYATTIVVPFVNLSRAT